MSAAAKVGCVTRARFERLVAEDRALVLEETRIQFRIGDDALRIEPMRPRESLTDSQQERLLEVRLACSDITRACDLARSFSDLVRNQCGQLLHDWIRQAEQDAPPAHPRIRRLPSP